MDPVTYRDPQLVADELETKAISYQRRAGLLLERGDRHLDKGQIDLAMSCYQGAMGLLAKAEDIVPLYLT